MFSSATAIAYFVSGRQFGRWLSRRSRSEIGLVAILLAALLLAVAAP
jgi:uncharacterized membrane protein YoaK (UPF0700 family)